MTFFQKYIFLKFTDNKEKYRFFVYIYHNSIWIHRLFRVLHYSKPSGSADGPRFCTTYQQQSHLVLQMVQGSALLTNSRAIWFCRWSKVLHYLPTAEPSVSAGGPRFCTTHQQLSHHDLQKVRGAVQWTSCPTPSPMVMFVRWILNSHTCRPSQSYTRRTLKLL